MPNLLCQPGDLAKVVYCDDMMVVGRIVSVDRFIDEHQRWLVTILGDPVAATGALSGLVRVSNRLLFVDEALEPLRGDEQESTERDAEVSHG
ncbi:hypothetical protein [Burkholderia glumae]|uniref:hypothetical protein n=1 Tax=Burkholderia glumae TaxID=337 RepID=UPI00215162E5|nr:hypothetical protein [Burkholderia glumae]